MLYLFPRDILEQENVIFSTLNDETSEENYIVILVLLFRIFNQISQSLSCDIYFSTSYTFKNHTMFFKTEYIRYI